MQYAVFKWHFLTDVRFGNSKGQLAESSYIMHSDTVFSALSIEALRQGGEAQLERLYQLCRAHELLLSDTMPFLDETYFLPKPMLSMDTKKQESDSKLKKEYKKLHYISAEQFPGYLKAMRGEAEFDVAQANDLFQGCVYEQNRVMVGVQGRPEPQPYNVSTWHFAENAGLYLIVGYRDESSLRWLEQLIIGLGYSGVGGKKSSGLGKFEADDIIFLEDGYSEGLRALQQLLAAPGRWLMTLSGALPQDAEIEEALDGAYYQVQKRSGFIDSPGYAAEQRKRRNLYILAAGSCFAHPFAGGIYDVSNAGSHPIYRYALPMFMGVEI